jgi:Tol biopolymer transport system component
MDVYKMALAGGEPIPLTDTPWDEFTPRWSPDGKEIAFFSASGSSAGSLRLLWVMSSEGGRPSRLGGERGWAGEPIWSPDGLRIAYRREADTTVWVVSRGSIGGPWSAAARLADHRCFHHSWAPDGSGVLCSSGASILLISVAGQVVWSRDLNASSQLRIWTGAVTNYPRDGRTVYVGATHQDGRSGIWAITDAGRGAVRLVVAFDDPTVVPMSYISIGPDRLYLTVSEPESDIWVAKLRF